ncbi:hypothetical protein C9J03_13530 [Photobacterium gaetbulicola]|uniref:Lipoprotein n=1 Tax=Photobacterium gaetbulicola Gung47 TaxID=658445 RepID=A0A0C5WGT5_9GAMM|nr:hypothetical protein [Photobacterium gaetbulicola]AJR06323.1 hypothetical protein H744_1c1300 [Photobacterium gaetbulicola Gung47]PSU08738.1 hypothetical protein C9J03_13530 [Photobacterium gaetbulicola]
MKYCYHLLVLLVLAGCGGGDDGTSSQSQQEKPTTTLLGENTVPTDARFQQFETYLFEINPADFEFSGNRLYLKVYLSSGNTLYLGQIDKQALFAFPISVPVKEQVVRYDLFSDFAGDKAVTGESTL